MASARFPTYFYHTMKTEKNLRAEEPTSAPRPYQSKPRRSRLSLIRISLAALVIFGPGMILGSDGQTLQPPDGVRKGTNAEPSSSLLIAAQGRGQPSYQVFAYRCTRPAITVVDETTLEVGGTQKIDVGRLDRLTRQKRETVAGQLGVPVGVIDCLLRGCTNQAPADAAGLAGKVRVTVIDYKYLLERWTRYHPPTGGEKVKTYALLALQDGDIDKAWKMYVDLPRPEPPTGFRVAGGDLQH
jgi:hypothetical protein